MFYIVCCSILSTKTSRNAICKLAIMWPGTLNIRWLNGEPKNPYSKRLSHLNLSPSMVIQNVRSNFFLGLESISFNKHVSVHRKHRCAHEFTWSNSWPTTSLAHIHIRYISQAHMYWNWCLHNFLLTGSPVQRSSGSGGTDIFKEHWRTLKIFRFYGEF